MILEPRQRLLLQWLWRNRRLSRSALHERTGMRPTTIGAQTAALLEARILRACDVQAEGRGRPRVPLEIDPAARHVVGVAIQPGQVQVGRVSLLGEPLEPATVARGRVSARVIHTAAKLLAERMDDDTLAIGLTTPGFIDPRAHRMLFSSAVPGGRSASLQPIYDAAGDAPIALGNDAHALAAHWSLVHPQDDAGEDLLLVYLADGQLGASLLIEGKPNRGSVNGANELGHTHLPVETPPCYCGHTGCLERICSSEYLAAQDKPRHKKNNGHSADLMQRAAAYRPDSDASVERMIELLATGLANAVNLTRVGRLVLVSELTGHKPFAQRLTERVRHHTMGQLLKRLKIDLWDQLAANPARTAGCLVLAHLYCEGWSSPLTVGGQAVADF